MPNIKKHNGEKTLYDYFKLPNEDMHIVSLTITGKREDAVLCINAVETFLEMGDKGFLTGKAYLDYLKVRKEHDHWT